MATIRPFTALRPLPEKAAQVCELPYDVMSSEEARQMAAGNPLSFLHVSKAEIDFPPGHDSYAPEVYARARENFRALMAQGVLRQDPQACLYLYRQVMGNHSQIGLVAVASCQEYLNGRIVKHELTRPEKEDDRVRHIEAVEGQTGPVFLVYPHQTEIDELVARLAARKPSIDFTARDGVRHTAWLILETAELEFLQNRFELLPNLYIADGHHRCAAAGRIYQARKGEGHSAYFLSVIFPDNQVQILPYNRVLKDLNGMTPEQVLEKLDGVFISWGKGKPAPTRRHEVAFYVAGQWHTLHFRPRFVDTRDPIERLDVTLLQKYVLDPIFGVDDPRTSNRVHFVGGIRGTSELELLVKSGEYACAFSMYPTGINELLAVADAGGIMPPKSTWFEPKLRDAMFCHLL